MKYFIGGDESAKPSFLLQIGLLVSVVIAFLLLVALFYFIGKNKKCEDDKKKLEEEKKKLEKK